MTLSINYQNAFTEVCAILDCLDLDDYSKIPDDVISVFEKYKNEDYEYELDENVDLEDQPMLPETRAVLFNLFRDYLSTPEQKEKIKRMQKEDRLRNEAIKKAQYQSNYSFGKQTFKFDQFKYEPKEILDIRQEVNFFEKIKLFILRLFRRYK